MTENMHGLGSDFNAVELKAEEKSSYKGKCIACESDSGNYTHFLAVIPNFGSTDILGFSCDDCDYSYNKINTISTLAAKEVNSNYASQGKKLTINVSCATDLRRQVILSDYCMVKILQRHKSGLDISFQVSEGRFTTIEGILQSFSGKVSGMKLFDAVENATADNKLNASLSSAFVSLIENIEAGNSEVSFELILDDPSAQSYIGPLDSGNSESSLLRAENQSEADDARIIVELYDRNEEQNTRLGIATISKSSEGNDEGDVKTTTVESSASQEEMLAFLNQMAGAFGLGLDDEDKDADEDG